MQRTATLPIEFEKLRNEVQYVQKKSHSEYSSSCPQCGGVPHERGEWPDRFVMFVDDRPRGWCRKCGYLWWPDGEPRKLTREEELRHKEAEERELKRRKAEIEQRLEQIREDKAWLRWHIEMDEWGKQQWYARGLPDEFQDFWKLGLNPHYRTVSGFETPSLSIPCFGKDWELTQVYHRLLNIPPPPEGGKYRQTGGLRPALFIADPDYFLNEQVIVVEGQIKAQHVFKALLDHHLGTLSSIEHNGINVVAIPTVEPNIDIFEPIKNAKRVYLCLDPDSRDVNEKTGRVVRDELGIKIRDNYSFDLFSIETYDKVDDMILRLGLGAKWVADRMRRAVKL